MDRVKASLRPQSSSQKEGQKASLMKYVSVAFICYIGVLVRTVSRKKGTLKT